ncbi:MAG: prenyltransferase/squalene oxidase repeat-containing protein [Phycisphaerae bacterium]
MRLLTASFLTLLLTLPARAATPAETAKATIEKSLDYLVKDQQPSGSFQRSDREPPAVTALVLRAIVQSPKYGPASEPAKKAVAYLLTQQQPNGGIYKDMLATYNTAISLSALAAVNDPALKPNIEKAVTYLKGAQTGAIAGAGGAKIDPNDPKFGGWNYGGARGGLEDVSNTAIALEALKDAGLKPEDPAYQNALKFVTRLQNNSETNPSAKWVGDDGGFIYNPGKAGEGGSAAGEYTTPDGKRLLRSYGSMTYAGLKSLVYAGVSKDDPRVKAAWKWVGENFTVDVHPGLAANGPESARDGIYYYYVAYAKALAAYGEPKITDKAGKVHDWREALIAKLASVQNADGSFTGTQKWMENSPTIATSFAVLALQDAERDLAARK